MNDPLVILDALLMYNLDEENRSKAKKVLPNLDYLWNPDYNVP